MMQAIVDPSLTSGTNRSITAGNGSPAGMKRFVTVDVRVTPKPLAGAARSGQLSTDAATLDDLAPPPGHMRWRRLVAVFTAVSSCFGTSPATPPPAGGIHVLFVGNSLTYENDLPGTVVALGALVGDTIRVASAVGPDLALIDHLNGASNAVSQIQLGGWKYVVLQQGPSSVAVNRDSLTLWTKMFDAYIKAAGGQTALFMVWPSSDRLAFFDDMRLSYPQAAQSVGGVFMPAGEAWLAAWASDSTLALYSSDGYHPTPTGTYLASLVIYERVTGHDARQLPARAFAAGQQLSLAESTVRLLQAAAHTADQRYPAR
jgi:hypothetical protein